jgi:hypothetical protein
LWDTVSKPQIVFEGKASRSKNGTTQPSSVRWGFEMASMLFQGRQIESGAKQLPTDLSSQDPGPKDPALIYPWKGVNITVH